MVHDDKGGVRSLPQAQQGLTERGHGAGIVLVLVVCGIERIQDDDLGVRGARRCQEVLEALGSAEQMADGADIDEQVYASRRQFGPWGKVFSRLRTIRRWGPTDRLRELEQLRDLLEPVDPSRRIRVEIDLWPRSLERRQRAEERVRDLVRASSGIVLHTASIPEIRYHGFLSLPHQYFQSLLTVQDVDLLLADEIYLIRPAAQAVATVDSTFDHAGREMSGATKVGTPICALLDGLPMENHPHLRDRLLVDDPDSWAETYPVAIRRHGTAMASLILHGDQNEQEPTLRRPLYVRPILRPDSKNEEKPPRNRLVSHLRRLARIVRNLIQGIGHGIDCGAGIGYVVRLLLARPGQLLSDFLCLVYRCGS